MQIVHDNRNLEEGKKVYTCSTCDISFNWDNDSSWYGSYTQLENKPDEVRYFCSKECAEKHLYDA